jgi:hypothetical protein
VQNEPYIYKEWIVKVYERQECNAEENIVEYREWRWDEIDTGCQISVQ